MPKSSKTRLRYKHNELSHSGLPSQPAKPREPAKTKLVLAQGRQTQAPDKKAEADELAKLQAIQKFYANPTDRFNLMNLLGWLQTPHTDMRVGMLRLVGLEILSEGKYRQYKNEHGVLHTWNILHERSKLNAQLRFATGPENGALYSSYGFDVNDRHGLLLKGEEHRRYSANGATQENEYAKFTPRTKETLERAHKFIRRFGPKSQGLLYLGLF